MPTTDDELAKKGEDVQKLREQVQQAEFELAQAEREISNDVTAAALDKEADTLKAQLAALKERKKTSNLKASVAAVVDPDGNAAKVEEAKSKALVEAGDAPIVEADKPKGGSR